MSCVTTVGIRSGRVLFERDELLAALSSALDVARAGRGRVVLVSGEAGIGKTALARVFCEGVNGSATVLWGGCDALFTPQPLGPFLHLAEGASGSVTNLFEAPKSASEVVEALLGLARAGAPLILVLEDLHWADEATLDALRLLARRIGTSSALVLATYRDDELDRSHPLRSVLGELATSVEVSRMAVPRLSPTAVAHLAAESDVDAAAIYRLTAGNPFYVTEVLAAGGAEISESVRDLVLARVAPLSLPATALVEATSIAPPSLDAALMLAVRGEAVDAVEECLASGVLRVVNGGIAFRHELARATVEEALMPTRRLALHRAVLLALADADSSSGDLARLAHHAEGAGDADAVLRYAPAAGAQAADVGAHREAAAQYGRALRFAGGISESERADLLERQSAAHYQTDEQHQAIAALQLAIECHRRAGDVRREARALSRLVPQLTCPGFIVEAERAALDAISLLEPLSPGPELPAAYGAMAVVQLHKDDLEETIVWGTRAAELARSDGEDAILVDALTSAGYAEVMRDGPAASGTLEAALVLARRLDVGVARVLNNLAYGAVLHRAHGLTERFCREGLEYCADRDLDLWRLSLLGAVIRSRVDQGRWAEALDAAQILVEDPRASPEPRVAALLAFARVRARRGDPDAHAPLDAVLALEPQWDELVWLGPIGAARAEVAWLEGKHENVASVSDRALELAILRRSPWWVGELAYWRWKAGIQDGVLNGTAEPYALQIAGDWRCAAVRWADLGCPYEAALALSEADDEQALRDALDELYRLGARPAAKMVARRLREEGVRDVASGPRASTRENPARLTNREVEVLHLVTDGLRNGEIARRLFVSPRTVDHHVSSILRKLNVGSRGAAVAEASHRGLLEDR